MGLVADPALLAYVQAVGGRVAKQSPRQDVSYTFQIVNQPEPNAFALPNGNIYISRGLLALANSEDELAGVLGHEVVHVAARHTVRSANVAVATSPLRIATGIAGVAAGIVAPRLGEGIAGIGDVASEAFMAPYGRSQEREADDVGVALVARAGYDPKGLPHILQALEREQALRAGGPPRQSFFDTHPATPERVRETGERAAALRVEPAAPVVKTPGEFLAKLNGLLVGDDPSDGTFLESRFFQPTLGITLRFPAKWETRNTPRAVVGHTPDKEAVLLVTVAGKGDDPVRVARDAEKEAGVRLLERAVSLEVNGLRAVRSVVAVESRRGPTTLDLTWIAHGGIVYRILGVSPTPRFDAYRRFFDDTVSSFRGMTAADTAQLRETRLRVVAARAGERPADVARRTGSVWSANEIAVANALAADGPLTAGQTIKVAISEPYRARR
jgi:predicted Zn-dependent protease